MRGTTGDGQMANAHHPFVRVLGLVLVGCAWTSASAQPCGWSPGFLMPCGSHAMAYDQARGVTVLSGGVEAERQTWEWDGQTWALRATDGPPRSYHALA